MAFVKMENKEDQPNKDVFIPPPNVYRGETAIGRLSYFLRTIGDLQVTSVLNYVGPWLASRNGSVLEIGAGAQPYRRFIKPACKYQALDWAHAKEYFGYSAQDTAYYDGDIFPFADSSFENVFHTEVIEHIYDTRVFLSECKRVLKQNGAMFFTVPFQARYHYIPYDYWRFTPASLTRMLTEAGFTDIIISHRGNDITVMAYKIASLVYRYLLSGGAPGKIIGLMASPFLISALAIGHLSMSTNVGSTDDCLGYAVSARKL